MYEPLVKSEAGGCIASIRTNRIASEIRATQEPGQRAGGPDLRDPIVPPLRDGLGGDIRHVNGIGAFPGIRENGESLHEEARIRSSLCHPTCEFVLGRFLKLLQPARPPARPIMLGVKRSESHVTPREIL